MDSVQLSGAAHCDRIETGHRKASPSARIQYVAPQPLGWEGRVYQFRDECGLGTVDFLFQSPAMDLEAVMKLLELFAKDMLPRMQKLPSGN
jgi:hypothetical protein